MVVDGWRTEWNPRTQEVVLFEGKGCQCEPQCMTSRVVGLALSSAVAITVGEEYMLGIITGKHERINGIG